MENFWNGVHELQCAVRFAVESSQEASRSNPEHPLGCSNLHFGRQIGRKAACLGQNLQKRRKTASGKESITWTRHLLILLAFCEGSGWSFYRRRLSRLRKRL